MLLVSNHFHPLPEVEPFEGFFLPDTSGIKKDFVTASWLQIDSVFITAETWSVFPSQECLHQAESISEQPYRVIQLHVCLKAIFRQLEKTCNVANDKTKHKNL